jgi:membrane protein
MLVFIASTTGLRVYIAVLTSTGYTYGALATPIAFLLFAFLLGLSIVLGAHLNNAVEEVWPSRFVPRRGLLHRLWPARLRGRQRAASVPVATEPTGHEAVIADLPPDGRAAHAARTGPVVAEESR